jgi:endonuclease/exonuclease/phosphatase family metal-dependent hydrolase
LNRIIPLVVEKVIQTQYYCVATLNLAHGRKDSLNQLLLWTSTIKENLNDIADVLGQHKPHVVALQEADAASFWSGSFDHVEYLASNAHYPCLIGWADFLIYCRK